MGSKLKPKASFSDNYVVRFSLSCTQTKAAIFQCAAVPDPCYSLKGMERKATNKNIRFQWCCAKRKGKEQTKINKYDSIVENIQIWQHSYSAFILMVGSLERWQKILLLASNLIKSSFKTGKKQGHFLVADARLYTLPCRSVRRSVRPVTFLNSEWFSHYCSCPTVRDCIAVYPALLNKGGETGAENTRYTRFDSCVMNRRTDGRTDGRTNLERN